MTRTTFAAAFLAALLSALPASAQRDRGDRENSQRALITGRLGSPKCTIEVEVDDVADIEVRGTVARLHSLNGRGAQWRRFECNQPMPANPPNFRFRGIDGRGRQTLIGFPSNGGPAVVRIEDPKAGSEGYTFDLEWGGAPDQYGYGNRPGGFGYPSAPPPPPYAGGGDWSSNEAVRRCSQDAEAQLRRNGYSDTRVLNANIDDGPGHNDWVSGSLSGRRGPYSENFSFACSVDFQARQLGAVTIRPANDGYYGRDGFRNHGWTPDQAKRACVEAVQQRLQRDGYRDIRIQGINLEDQPGDNDWASGGLVARRGGYSDQFAFSCSVDFDDARIRSINVDRR